MSFSPYEISYTSTPPPPKKKKINLTLIEAVPSAADSGTGGPSATPLSPNTTTPAAGPPPPGRSTLADSVTGEHAGVPLGGSAERVTRQASYPTCAAGSMAASGMP